MRKKEKVSQVVVRRSKGKRRKTLPVALVPRTLEEAPLRRMDRRALNALRSYELSNNTVLAVTSQPSLTIFTLRKRRADKHMIAFLAFIATLMTLTGSAAIVVWVQLRSQFKFVGLLIIVGPILVIAGISTFCCSLELVFRLRKQIKRVVDPSLLKTNNYHEVKHWIEPGKLLFYFECILVNVNSLELISFGWGQYDFEEESKMMDDNKLRRRQQSVQNKV